MLQLLAKHLAQSRCFSRGKKLFEQNSLNWNLPLSKADKLLAGTYVILEDYSKGLFPPKFEDRSKAYAAEIAYRTMLPGQNLESLREAQLPKPFWFGRSTKRYLGDFIRLNLLFERLNLRPPARLLELGCGTGWMAEFLAIEGFDVTGTSIVRETSKTRELACGVSVRRALERSYDLKFR